ncbi:ECF transporter S component [Agrilactobacillus yilanensis]|uniref:ECF transporter S component n=1 Tax=Agrilactobacillus yilanensis TaxID=2485997 RepID=A0ABW4JAK9_9LACO|nr:ECF transporter S component [Agrilactobacillus yilanensis]
MGKTKRTAFEISILGLLSALILLQVYIPIVIPGGLQIVTVHITVALGAIILGTRDGAILGLVWGLLSLFRAYTSPASPLTILLFTNPAIAIIPRVLVGIAAGLLFNVFYQKTKLKKAVSLSITGVGSALVNTLFVLLLTVIFFQHDPNALFGAARGGGSNTNLLIFLLTVFGINSIIEAVTAGVLVPLIGTPLLRFKKEK